MTTRHEDQKNLLSFEHNTGQTSILLAINHDGRRGIIIKQLKMRKENTYTTTTSNLFLIPHKALMRNGGIRGTRNGNRFEMKRGESRLSGFDNDGMCRWLDKFNT